MNYLNFFRSSDPSSTIDSRLIPKTTQIPEIEALPDPEQIAIEGDLGKLLERSSEWGEKFQKSKQEEQTLIQEKSLLRHLPWNENPTELDLRFLAQLSGEGFIRENPLEGYSFDESIHYYIQFFEALLRNKDKSDVQVLTPYLARIQTYLDQMKACKKITAKIEAIVSAGATADDDKKADMIKKYAVELSKDFSNGALEWFPAGWQNSLFGGHALMLKFEKNGTIAFVNSGAGLDYHDSAQYTIATENGSRNKTLHQQFLTIKSGDKARLGSVDFFQFLLEMNVYPRWDGSIKLGAKIIYEGLLKYLKGKVVGNHDPKKEEYLFKTAQRSGCCAVKAVSTGFYYHLCGIWGGKEKNPEKAVEAYKKVKFMWERQALISQCMSLLPEQSKLQDNPKAVEQFYPATEKLIEDIMQNMGREAESLHGKKLLSHEELLSIHATFLDIRERITAVKDYQARVNSEIMHCERDYQVPQQQSLKIEIPTPKVNRARKPLDIDPLSHESQIGKLSEQMMSSRVDSLKDPKEASKTLNNWLNTLEPILTDRQDWFSNPDSCKIMLNHFQRILCELPIPGANESFWQQVPEDQILDCMRTLQKLMSVLLLVNRGHTAYSHTAETVTTSYACYAIINELANRLPETKLKEAKSTVNYYDLLKQIRSPYFLNNDPKIQEQLTKVLKYFDSSYSIDNASQLTDSELAVKAKESLFCYDEKGWNGNEGPSLKINSVSVKQNKLLGYFAKFLEWDNPEVRKKLIAQGIYPDEPLEEQLKKMLYGHNPVLPESVQILQQASLSSSVICKCHALYTYSASIQSFDQLPSFRFSEKSGKCNWGHPANITFSDQEGYNVKHLESPLTEVVDRDLNPLLVEDYSKTTQNKIIHEKIAHLGLNLEDSKELSMLGVDPYDEVNRTLSFALRHIPLLKKTQLQDIINIHLFKHGRILSQLKDSPQFAEQMTEFLEEALDYYLKSKDTETCLYLAKIGHRMALFAKHCGIKPQRPFPDFEKIILDSVIPMTKNYSLIKKNCEMIIKWHPPFNQRVGIDDASLQNIAQAVAMASLSSRLQIQGIAEDVGYSGLDHERTGTISKWGLNLETRSTQRYLMPKIKALMERDKIAREKLLNRALNMMISDNEGHYEWSGDFPNYSCGLYEINIENGVVKKNGKELVTLPESVLRDADFRRLKIKTITHVSKKDNTTYIIYPDEIEISYKDPKIEIRKKIDGTIYRLHNAAAYSLNNGIPTLFTEGYEYWLSEKPGSANQHCLCLKDGEPSIKLGLGQIYEDDKQVKSIERGDSEWVAFANIPASLKKVLNYIEPNSKYIECWRRKNQTVLESVSLKRLGLKFNIKQEGNKALAYCQEYPGFFISENRYIVPTLLETDPYIVLENAAGEKKVVMPKLPLSSTISATSALNRTLIYSMPDKPTKALIEFSIQDGELYSSFIEPRIYLSLIYLAKGDYEKTSKLLKKLNVTAAFTKKDKIILEWMVQILCHDQHPAAVSILLSLVALTEENKLKFPPSVGTKNESLFNHQKIHQSYSQYMQNWGNIPAFRLSEDEEKSILLFLKKEGKVALDKMDFFARLAPEVGNAIKLVEKRLNELSTRSSELGYSSTERKQMQEDVLKFDYYSTFTYQHAFEDYQPPTTPKFQVDAILMRDSGLLMGKFAEFYDVATRGSLEERTKLKAFLDLQKGNIDEDHQTT